MTRTTLVAGGTAASRETSIAAALIADTSSSIVLILKGAPDKLLEFLAPIQAIRLAPGCPCCTGKLPMQVTLNRVLHKPPERLLIALAHTSHLAAMREFLSQPS